MATRREMLQALVAATGAGIAVPGLSAQNHIGRHLAESSSLQQADTKPKARAYQPEFLDQHQFDTLQSLAERIVPDASRANTSEFIDQLLVVDSREDQRDFLTAIGAFEGQAMAR